MYYILEITLKDCGEEKLILTVIHLIPLKITVQCSPYSLLNNILWPKERYVPLFYICPSHKKIFCSEILNRIEIIILVAYLIKLLLKAFAAPRLLSTVDLRPRIFIIFIEIHKPLYSE